MNKQKELETETILEAEENIEGIGGTVINILREN